MLTSQLKVELENIIEKRTSMFEPPDKSTIFNPPNKSTIFNPPEKNTIFNPEKWKKDTMLNPEKKHTMLNPEKKHTMLNPEKKHTMLNPEKSHHTSGGHTPDTSGHTPDDAFSNSIDSAGADSMILPAAAMIIAGTGLAYGIYKRFFSAAARACRGTKGQQRKQCIIKFRQAVLRKKARKK
jgi:Fe-S cluster biosynthesis and repair protein YggX